MLLIRHTERQNNSEVSLLLACPSEFCGCGWKRRSTVVERNNVNFKSQTRTENKRVPVSWRLGGKNNCHKDQIFSKTAADLKKISSHPDKEKDHSK